MTFGLRAEFGKTGRIVITEGHPVPERAGWIVTPIGGFHGAPASNARANSERPISESTQRIDSDSVHTVLYAPSEGAGATGCSASLEPCTGGVEWRMRSCR